MPYYGYGYYFDPTYMLVLIGVVISLIASAKVKGTYAKYSKVRSRSGMTGAQAADRILKSAGLYEVRIEHIAGSLTDHYDPRTKVLRLSDSVYGSASVAAIGVAAHECGHAIQDDRSYAPLRIRNTLVPAANIGTQDASARAIRILGDSGILYEEEVKQTRKVLSAAAMTYVAAAAASILSLLRLLILFGGRDRD